MDQRKTIAPIIRSLRGTPLARVVRTHWDKRNLEMVNRILLNPNNPLGLSREQLEQVREFENSLLARMPVVLPSAPPINSLGALLKKSGVA